MPILDMPLEQLKTYQGTNPCPPDIDVFWDASVAEMEALGTDFELTEAEYAFPGAKCYHLWFTGMGGARIHAKLAMPERIDKPIPGLCYFHGYCGAAPEFSTMLSYVQCGFVIAALDCRGQGGRSEDVGGVRGNTQCGHIIRGLDEKNPSRLLFRNIFLDAAQLARIVMNMPEVDKTRVGTLGGSQGGALALACAALTPAINRVVSMQPFLCDYKRVWHMDLCKNAYQDIREYFRRYDPLHDRENEVFMLLGYIDNQHLAHRIRAEVLMFTGLMDNICPPSTQFAAYNKIETPKQMYLYPDYGHEYLPDRDDRSITFLLGMKS